MVKVRENLVGKIFGDLTVVRQTDDYINPNGFHYAQWLCNCSCGCINVVVTQGHLKSGHTMSCGHALRRENRYDLSGAYGIGWTTNTNCEFYFDLEDYDKIKNYHWYEHHPCDSYRTLLAYDKNIHRPIKFWWVVFGKDCDHISHNTFDNQKRNLRECTFCENRYNSSVRNNNTSTIIGVYFHKDSAKWVAYLNKNQRRIYTSKGCVNKDEAIRLRLLAEQKYFGQFAPQKDLFKQYGIEVDNDVE